MQGSPGTQLVTADAAIGVSGKPVRVFSAAVLSGGGGAGIVIFRNGTSATSTIYAQIDGTTSKGTQAEWLGGILFPAGCFCDIDANVTSVAVNFTTEV